MKFNTKLLSALMAAGLLMPVALVQAWPTWLGGAPLLKVQEKTKEEVKKEAAKQSSVVADLAWKGTKAVGKATAQAAWFTTKETVKFGYHNPRTAAALMGAGYLYYKRNDISKWINKKVEQTKAIVNAVAPVAGVAVATKLAYDAFGNLLSARSNVVQPAVAPAQAEAQKAVSAAVKPAVKSPEDIEKEDLEMEILAQEFLAFQSAEKLAEEIEREEKQEGMLENAWKEGVSQPKAVAESQDVKNTLDITKRAQERAARLRPTDVTTFENAWKQTPAASEHAQAIDQEVQHIARQLHQPERPEALVDLLHSEAARSQAQAFINPVESSLIEPVVPANEWAQEFKDMQKAEAADDAVQETAWVKEFKERALNRAVTLARHITESASIDDESDAASTESLEDSKARSMHKDMIDVYDRLQPECAPTALRGRL